MDRMPRAVASHALCGFGKNALGIALPVLSACGVEVYPLPTALLSANAAFPSHTFLDMTDAMPASIAHWQCLQLCPDAVYTGFLGSPAQAGLLLRMAIAWETPLLAVDPVLGDHGRLYAITTPEHCAAMERLAAGADLLTPNLTEACLLTGTDPVDPDVSSCHVEALCRKLAQPGVSRVVITGVTRPESSGVLYNCALDNGVYREYAAPRVPVTRFGTGDVFASVLVGSLLTRHTLEHSIQRAASFVGQILEYSLTMEDSERRGVCFEPFLGTLSPEL